MTYAVYGKENCASCLEAKQLLKQKGLEFEYKNLTTDYTLAEFMSLSRQKSFPLILKGKEVIGTLTDLKGYLVSNNG